MLDADELLEREAKALGVLENAGQLLTSSELAAYCVNEHAGDVQQWMYAIIRLTRNGQILRECDQKCTVSGHMASAYRVASAKKG